MQPLYIILTFLSSLFFLPSVSSIECNETQYEWPMPASRLCCNKCLPGQQMDWRSNSACEITCLPCPVGHYSDSHNTEMNCKACKKCIKYHMVQESACNATHNTVCTCRNGYTCKDRTCTQCVPTPATSKPTSAGTTLTTGILTTSRRPYRPVQDTVWFLVIIALLCGGIALVIVTKIKPFLQWMRSKRGYFLAEKPAVHQCAVDEEVSKPVQEVCGKCDQPIDV